MALTRRYFLGLPIGLAAYNKKLVASASNNTAIPFKLLGRSNTQVAPAIVDWRYGDEIVGTCQSGQRHSSYIAVNVHRRVFADIKTIIDRGLQSPHRSAQGYAYTLTPHLVLAPWVQTFDSPLLSSTNQPLFRHGYGVTIGLEGIQITEIWHPDIIIAGKTQAFKSCSSTPNSAEFLAKPSCFSNYIQRFPDYNADTETILSVSDSTWFTLACKVEHGLYTANGIKQSAIYVTAWLAEAGQETRRWLSHSVTVLSDETLPVGKHRQVFGIADIIYDYDYQHPEDASFQWISGC